MVCGCLKDFLRNLKEPLITFGLWKDFAKAAGMFIVVTQKRVSKRTTKPAIRPAMSQISLYIHPVWQGFLLIPLWIAWRLQKAHAISEDWSDCVDGQADLSLCWSYKSYCWFCCVLAHVEASPYLCLAWRILKLQNSIWRVSWENVHSDICLSKMKIILNFHPVWSASLDLKKLWTLSRGTDIQVDLSLCWACTFESTVNVLKF